jgi:hypothetical protein
MNTLMQRTLLLATALFTLAGAVSAQGGQGEYVIQGIFSPTIADAQKIDLRPQPIDTILPVLPVSYDVIPVKAVIPATVDSIAAAKLNVVQPQQRLYKGYVKAGFGLYTTPLGELYYDQTRSRKEGYGLHIKHFSSNGGLKDVGPSDYSLNNVDGYYDHYLRNHVVGGRLMYDRRRVSIRSLYKDSTLIAHDIGLEVHSYKSLSESRETNVKITADLSKAEQGDRYGLGILIDNNAYRGILSNGVFGEVQSATLGDLRINGTLVGLTPQITREGEKYVVRVGSGIYVDAQGKTTFHFFPKAYASYSLFDDILVPYIGFEGERRRNSFRSLTRENPWLIGTPILANSSLLYDLYGGLRGSFSSKLGFDVRMSISSIEDRPLYVSAPNFPFGDRMAVVYDRVDQFNISGQLTYKYDEGLRLNGRIDVTTYDTKGQLEAWNLPPYRIGLGANYSLQNKLIVTVEALFLGERKAAFYNDPADASATVTVNPTVQDLDGFLDLHLGLEYRYTKRLSVFLDMSNLSASKYERWYRYPVQRGLLLGGATYAF